MWRNIGLLQNKLMLNFIKINKYVICKLQINVDVYYEFLKHYRIEMISSWPKS